MDEIADLSQELASMGRGSLMRKIAQLETELKEAYAQIHNLNNQVQNYKIQEQLRKATEQL